MATAIRITELAAAQCKEVSVVVLEKGSEPGAHILAGAILDPRSLTELIPNWKDLCAPLPRPVTRDQFLFLTATGAHRNTIPPACFHNEGCYVISLGQLGALVGHPGRSAGG